MPTIRPRHQITETAEVARAIDLAAKRWPDETRARLLGRLIDVGRSVLDEQLCADLQRRRASVEGSSGKYTGAFGEGYLEELRGDWPA